MIGFRLDGLEALNETDGVEFTNSLLKNLVRLYKSELEKISDENPDYSIPDEFKSLYRVESNSFIFIKNVPRMAALLGANQPLLAEIIQKLLVEHHGKVLLTFHGGFTFYPEEAQTLQQLFRNLLNLLHTRRVENIGQFVAFNPELYKDYLRQEAIRIELQKAVQHNGFSLVFQPRVDVSSGRTMDFEALARWDSPVLGKIPPSEFIPLAENLPSYSRLRCSLWRRHLISYVHSTRPVSKTSACH